MDATAYWLALVTVIAVPPFAVFWFFVHPFTSFWRKLGPAKAYPTLFAVVVVIMVIMYQFRAPLLRIHFAVTWPLTALAITLFAASMFIGVLCVPRLGHAGLLGLPQLSDREYPGRLVTDGIYAYMRHPRYIQVGFGLAATALFTNYLAVYVIAAAYIPVIYLVVLLEERELRERFGQQYEEYAGRVPRFLPRLIPRKS